MLQFDPRLAEVVVFEAIRAIEAGGGGESCASFDRERERIYGLTDRRQRDAAFRRLHESWLSTLGFSADILEAAAEAGVKFESIHCVFVHGVAGRTQEGSELFEKDGRRTLVLALRPARFRDRSQLLRFARHEFRLAADLMDSRFEFARELDIVDGVLPPQLLKDRYRLLWSISADGRIERAGFEGLHDASEWRQVFDKTFSFLDPAQRDDLFDQVHGSDAPSHKRFLSIARNPRTGFGNHLTPPGGSAPGTLCPLCGFPTFEWCRDLRQYPNSFHLTIGARHPGWTVEQGACASCVERYALTIR